MFNFFPIEGGLDNIKGFFSDGVSAGLKPNGANDVAFIYSDELCNVNGVFTTNTFQAAPIVHFQRYPKGFKTNFVLINSKNANAMTGEAGIRDIDSIFKSLSAKFPNIHNPIMSSTGVIGYRLNLDKIIQAFEKFHLDRKNSDDAAKAIMTTDRFKKELCLRVELEDGGVFHIGAICKGAGMINPAMATMLCFICTDAAIPNEDAKKALKKAVKYSFNAASVDGDTSTNDTVLLLSNKRSGVYQKEAFEEALNFLTRHLALEIVRDGEGAKKLVAFEVRGALNEEEAQRAAKALSNSLLVKTALFGEDPNWGRIASTIGASKVTCKAEDLSIYYDEVLIYDKNNPELDGTTEAKATEVMQRDSFKICCDLGAGNSKFTAYGCDLGYDYVQINADYRT